MRVHADWGRYMLDKSAFYCRVPIYPARTLPLTSSLYDSRFSDGRRASCSRAQECYVCETGLEGERDDTVSLPQFGVWTDENEKRSDELWPVFASSISTSTSAK